MMNLQHIRNHPKTQADVGCADDRRRFGDVFGLIRIGREIFRLTRFDAHHVVQRILQCFCLAHLTAFTALPCWLLRLTLYYLFSCSINIVAMASDSGLRDIPDYPGYIQIRVMPKIMYKWTGTPRETLQEAFSDFKTASPDYCLGEPADCWYLGLNFRPSKDKKETINGIPVYYTYDNRNCYLVPAR